MENKKKKFVYKMGIIVIGIGIITALYFQYNALIVLQSEYDQLLDEHIQLRSDNQELLRRFITLDMSPQWTADLTKVEECWLDLCKPGELKCAGTRTLNVTMPKTTSGKTDCQLLEDRCGDSFPGFDCNWSNADNSCNCRPED